MNISFKGIQNAGVFCKKDENRNESSQRIAVQLNNNGQKDLDEFKEILKKYPDSINSDFLDLTFKTTPNRVNGGENYNVFVNSRKIQWNDENLPILSKINKLINRIAQGEEAPASKEYKTSKECTDRFYSDLFMSECQDKQAMLDEIHDSNEVKTTAGKVSKTLVENLSDYCLSGQKNYFSEVKSVGGFSYKTFDKETGKAQNVDRLHLKLNKEDLEEYKEVFDKIPPCGEGSNTLIVDMEKHSGEKPILKLNRRPIDIESKNFPVIKKVSELLTKMSKTQMELPFDDDYLNSRSLDDMSYGVFERGQLDAINSADDETKEGVGIKLEMVKDSAGAKKMASKLVDNINEQLVEYFS